MPRPKRLRSEYVIAVKGTREEARHADTINEKIPTGEIELVVGVQARRSISCC